MRNELIKNKVVESNGDGSYTEKTYVFDPEGDLIQIEYGETWRGDE